MLDSAEVVFGQSLLPVQGVICTEVRSTFISKIKNNEETKSSGNYSDLFLNVTIYDTQL